MAPPQRKSHNRLAVPRPHCTSSRVSKKNRFTKANQKAKYKARIPHNEHNEPSEATSVTTSKAISAQFDYQTQQDKHRPRVTKSRASHPSLSLDGSPGSSRKEMAAEGAAEGVPGQFVSPLAPGCNMDAMPAEILQMIWGEVIKMPACHTFKVKSGDASEEGSRWSVHLWPGTTKEEIDTSAYQLWKQLLSLKNIGFQGAFRYLVKQIQPIALRLPKTKNSKYKAAKYYKVMAAIGMGQDLVILEMDRGESLPWFEHTLPQRHGMNWRLIRDRMSHFRRVALPYKPGQVNCAIGGAFTCLCHGGNQPHEDYKACPLTLASFLDLFPKLEQFYFVVEPKLVWHKKFAAAYRDEVAKNGFRAYLDLPGGPETRGKQFTLPRFFDTKYEYLQQAPLAYLQVMKMKSPWTGDESAQQCIIETLQYYKSLKGTERFIQKLEKRQKVRFGILITYLLEDKGKKFAK